ncbi:MAG: DUF4292 domain-containing protein [Bacteroidetes bacterium]|nr:DUF4292 domain-containing protein [Bacteroidota bacterium]
MAKKPKYKYECGGNVEETIRSFFDYSICFAQFSDLRPRFLVTGRRNCLKGSEMNKKLRIYTILALLISITAAISSCKSKSKIVNTESSKISAENFAKIFKEKAESWHSFSCKLSIEYSDGASNMTANATLRMKRDSIMWISISALGFEALRVLVTQDSFHIMQKMPRKSVTTNSINSLSNLIGYSVTINQLQSLILGNLILNPTQYRWSESPEEGAFYLKGRSDSIEVTQKYYFENIEPLEIVIRSLNTYNKTVVTYKGMQSTNHTQVPTKSIVKIEYSPEESPIIIKIDYHSPEFLSNLTFPFSNRSTND